MHPFLIADVFTESPLEGNQLGVFTEGAEVPARLMQRAARELNFAETVFLLPPDDPQRADARIRIFTPVTELPFAGHPTLGSAFVVGEQTGLSRVRLQTGAGIVPIELTRHGEEITFGEMEQPIPVAEPFELVQELLSPLGLERSELPIEQYRNGPVHVFVTLGSREQVAQLSPDLGALEALGPFGVNCFALEDGRVKTRMFGPALGVPEDPATGSAAGPLALHLIRHGRIQYGQQIEIEQGTEVGRPSLLQARVEGAGERVERVLVGGSAVIVARGEYRLQ